MGFKYKLIKKGEAFPLAALLERADYYPTIDSFMAAYRASDYEPNGFKISYRRLPGTIATANYWSLYWDDDPDFNELGEIAP